MIQAKDSYFYNRLQMAAEEQPEIFELRDKLLNIGGDDFVALPIIDPFIPLLARRGFLMKGEPKLRRMRSNRCHENCARLWLNKRDELKLTGLGFGYALSDDGLWRQHSWCIHPEKIVETTAKREKYFGLHLHGKSADFFANTILDYFGTAGDDCMWEALKREREARKNAHPQNCTVS